MKNAPKVTSGRRQESQTKCPRISTQRGHRVDVFHTTAQFCQLKRQAAGLCLNLLPSGLYRRLRPLTESTPSRLTSTGRPRCWMRVTGSTCCICRSYRRSGIGVDDTPHHAPKILVVIHLVGVLRVLLILLKHPCSRLICISFAHGL